MIKVIAEIGNNHQGDIRIARQLIDVAANAGCWAVKSQKRSMRPEWKEKVYDNPNSFGKTYYEHRAALELSPEQHRELMRYARDKHLEYFVSPWDSESVMEMEDVGMGRFKVASACLTDSTLLAILKNLKKPVILSTGMSTKKEIMDAYIQLSDCLECIMLCTSYYPCDFVDIRLKRLEWLQSLCEGTQISIGFSGHHKGIAIDIAAVALGCHYIERHITLDRSMKGSDHAASLEPSGLIKLLRDLQAFQEANTEGPEIVDKEIPIREKLRASAP